MKTIKHIILAVLVLFTAMSFVSCQKEKYDGQEQVTVLDPNHTEDLFRLAVENGYSLYSYSEKGSYHHFTFHDVKVIESVKDRYPKGINEIDVPKAVIKDINASTSEIKVTFVSGKIRTMKRYGELLLSLPEVLDTTAFRGYPLNIPFQVVSSVGGELSYHDIKSDGCEVRLNLEDGKNRSIVITPNKENGYATVTLTNGIAFAKCEILFDTYGIELKETPDSFGDGEPFQFEIPFLTNLPLDGILINSEPWAQTELQKVSSGDSLDQYVIKVTLSRNETNQVRNGSVAVSDKEGHLAPIEVSLSQPYILINGEGMVPFKEKAFKEAVLAIADTNGDLDISPEEALAVKELNISGKGIKDLTGLDYFKNVWKLDAQDNDIIDGTIIKELHLLHWLDLKGNKNLRTFDVTTCTFFFERCEFEVTEDLVYYTSRNQVNITNTSDPMCDHSRHIRDDRQTTDWSRQDEIITVKKHTKGNGYPIVFSSFSLIDVDINDGTYERFMMDFIDFMFIHEPDREFLEKWGDYLDIYIVLHLEPNRNYNDFDEKNYERYRSLVKDFYKKHIPIFARHPEKEYQIYFRFLELNPVYKWNEASGWIVEENSEMSILGGTLSFHTRHEKGETGYRYAGSTTKERHYVETGWPTIQEDAKEKIVEIITDPNY